VGSWGGGGGGGGGGGAWCRRSKGSVAVISETLHITCSVAQARSSSDKRAKTRVTDRKSLENSGVLRFL